MTTSPPRSEQDSSAILRSVEPFLRFFRTEAASGALLLVTAVVALVWANSPQSAGYFALWETPVTIGAGDFVLSKSLHHWINDGLMAVFFFVVGLEVKREILVGELASLRRAALPIAAALGGMVVPAGLYVLVNAGGPGVGGWAIPMATDIAFALGVLALLGSRAPLALKVFLAALAIVDDIGAVLVIALAYTAELDRRALLVAAVAFAALLALNRAGIRRPGPFVLLGLLLWLGFLKSGIHATIAGVLLAVTIPARTRLDARGFAARARGLVDDFAAEGEDGARAIPGPRRTGLLQAITSAAEDASSPLQRLEHNLHGAVAFFVMPVFALANAGVRLGGGGELAGPIGLGIGLGLVIGKPAGIVLFTWLALRLGLAAAPGGVRWRDFLGVGFLAGIGFTMALFIADLAFGGTALHDQAKLGILVASLVAGLVGAGLLLTGRRRPEA